MRLLKASLAVGQMTLLSRVAGFVRDIVIANAFGAGAAADAFFVAFRIPNLFRRLFAEGSFSQAFVPVLSEYRERHDHDAVRLLVASVAGVLGAVLALITAAGILAAPLLVLLFAPGFADEPDRYGLTVEMLRITFPYLLFISIAALAGSVLNTFGRFTIPAFSPVLLNLAMIAAALLVAPRMDRPVVALAWGVFAGGVLQLGIQLPALRRLALLSWPRFTPAHAGVRRIMQLMLPSLFGASISQVNVLINTLLASFLVTGSVSWLYYSDRLIEFPLGVFSVALATAILPHLSSRHARGAGESFSHALDWALRCVVVVVLPAAAGLAVLALPLMSTLFQYGAMTAHDAANAARSLAAYAPGLLGFSLVKILAPAFFARQDTRTPVRAGVISVACNVVLNLLLVGPFAHVGLAGATSIAAFVNAAILFRQLRGDGSWQPGAGWTLHLARVAGATAGMGALLLLFSPPAEAWAGWQAAERALRLGGLVATGVLAYAALLWLSGLRPQQLRAPDA